MKIIQTTALIGALILGSSFAADLASPWNSVSFRVPRGADVVAVHLEGEEKLTKILLTLDGVAQEVPSEELEGIDLPQLDTAQIYFGKDYYGPFVEGEEPIPHAVIELAYGKPSNLGGFSTVRFLFHSGKYQERTTIVRETTTLWKETIKPVGEESYEGGTITRPNPDKAPSPKTEGE